MEVIIFTQGVQIFVERWGGDNLQFYPNFQDWGMNVDHDFFLGEQIKWRPKKRSSTKMKHFYSPYSGEDQIKKKST